VRACTSAIKTVIPTAATQPVAQHADVVPEVQRTGQAHPVTAFLSPTSRGFHSWSIIRSWPAARPQVAGSHRRFGPPAFVDQVGRGTADNRPFRPAGHHLTACSGQEIRIRRRAADLCAARPASETPAGLSILLLECPSHPYG